MKIKITNPARKWPVECGKVYFAEPGAPGNDGQKIYWVHTAGNFFGVRENECEEIKEDEKQ